ncbi:hypothetical protein H9P43_007104 [Blastocladiella emersonii ATCC 22665]|nr:hypothetical protein H9P43_007104 [Blastocladiella emersonii ATCC 22665]
MHQLLPAAIIAVVALLAPRAAAGPVQCVGSNSICFQLAPTPGNTTSSVDILIATKIVGWIGLGVGNGMSNTDMVMAWQSSTADNGWAVSRRLSTQKDLPPRASVQFVSVVNTTKTPDALGYYYLRLRRPVEKASSAAGEKTLTNAAMPMSWAYLASSSVSASNLPRHSRDGSFSYNPLGAEPLSTLAATGEVGLNVTLATGGSASSGSGSSSRETAMLVHGILMGVAWSALSFIGILIARFGKHRFGARWFPLHRGLFGVAILFTIGGFLAAVLTTDSDHFDSTHGKLGLAVTIVAVGQIVLGFVIDKMFDPDRAGIPLRDKAHWLAGYFLAVAAPVNVYLGHNANGSDSGLVALNIVVFGLFVILFGFLQVQVGQVHDKKKSDDSGAPLVRRGSIA